jgi:outer membrane protein insertion porin family
MSAREDSPHVAPHSTQLTRVCRLAAVLGLLLTVVACHPAGDIKVAGLAFEGNTAFSDGDLANVIATKKSGWLPWSRPHYFDRELFQTDLGRLRAFYEDRGYPDARISIGEIAFNEARDAVRIRIDVDEGQPLIVDRIDVTGVEQLEPVIQDALQTLPLKVGDPLDRARLSQSVERAAYVLRDRGYPFARVEASDQVDDNTHRAVVTLAAEPGVRSTFGEIAFVGNTSVSDNLIRRSLAFRPGRLYRESRVLESQRRLAALELFDFAHVTARSGETPATPGVVPMVVTVAEGPQTRLDLGVGYGTEDGPRGSAEWRHNNFLGDARQFHAETKYSVRSRGAGIHFVEPYFLMPRLSLGLDAGAWLTTEPIYRSRSFAGRAVLTYRLLRPQGTQRNNLGHVFRIGYANETQRHTIEPEALEDLTLFDELIALGLDPVTGSGSGRKAAVAFDVERTLVDSPLDPRKGHTASLHLEHAAPWLGGTYDYDEIVAEGRLYLPFGARRVLATRVRGGALRAQTAADIPFSARYFLGGSQSLRGWGRYQVAPLSIGGQPIGGETMVELSTEVRQMFTERIGAVVFVDAGNVWRSGASSEARTLRVAVGPGLRYTSPFGVVRADLGIQLTPIDGLLVNGEPERRRWRVHFSIGHIF